MDQDRSNDRLLTPREVAARFRVDPKTVTRWGSNGLLPCVRTPGGHRRFWQSDVDALLAETGSGAQAAA